MSLFQPALAAPALALGDIPLELPFAAILEAQDAVVDYAVHLRPWSDAAGGLVDIWWSTLGFTSGPEDTPANRHFAARVAGVSFSRRIAAAGLLGGRSDLRSAEIEVIATDAALELDGAVLDPQGLMRAFSIVGRPVEIRLVTDSYAGGKPIFVGTAQEWESARAGRLVIRLRGRALALDVPLQPASYGGAGGEDGTEDLRGKSKPVLFGHGRGLAPALEDPAQRLFRLHTDAAGHGAPIQGIDRVLLGGVELPRADSGTDGDFPTTAALLAASSGALGDDIEPGEFATCLAEGAFRLGADFEGQVMVEARGAVIGGDHAELPGALARALLTGWGAQLDEAGLVLASFTTLDIDAPWPVHLWAGAGAEMTAAAALDALMASVGGTWTDRPTGGLAVYRVRRAAGDPLIAFDDGQIVEGSWEWVPMPREVRPAVSEVNVGHSRSHTVSRDLREGAAAADRAFFAEEYRTVRRTQAIARFAETRRPRIDTLLTTEAGAQALGDALLALHDGTARRASFRAKHRGLAVTMGAKLRLTHAREGVAEQLALVVGIGFDSRRHDVTLDVLLEPGA